MKLRNIIENLQITNIKGSIDIDISDIQYDSRKTTPGSLFVCVKGFKSDGHSFINNEIEKGVKAFLVEENYYDCVDENVTIITVKDTRTSMAVIASNFYNNPTNKLSVIGVTGTNGKTSITTLLKSILDVHGKCGLVGTIKIYDGKNEIMSSNTTPESIDLQKHFNEMINNNCNYCAMEVSSHSLSLNRVDNVDFNIGIFTNLTPDHLDFHNNLDNYREAKELLFRKASSGNIINIDDDSGEIILNNIKKLPTKVYTYSINKEADFMAKDINLSKDGVSYTLVTPTYKENIYVPVPGKFTIYNTLAVISATYLLNIPIDIVKKQLEDTKGVPGRFENIRNDKGITVIVDYAHTPDALENVLKTAKEFAKKRIITVFGCGGDRDKSKRPLMGKIAQEYSTISIVTCDNPRCENPNAIIDDITKGMDINKGYVVVKDRKEAINKAIEEAKEDDIVMIVGKGHEDYQIIGTVKHHFDDKEVAKEAIDKKNIPL